jgi:hypothetical protein
MTGFTAQLDRFIEKTGLKADLVFRKVAFDGYRGLLLRSPVGNPDLWKRPPPKGSGYVGGRFRGNWRIALNKADTRVTPDRSTVKTGGELTGAEEAGALSTLAQARFGDSIHITQSVPYAIPIEREGHSTQAPEGVLRPTFEELKAKLNDTIKSAVEGVE